MSKPIKFLVTEIEGEREILTEGALALCGLDDEMVKDVFANSAYWIRVTLKDCDYGDQQAALREAAGDTALLPQKRFVRAVERWEKQYAAEDTISILEVSEAAFVALKPPGLGNLIQDAIVQMWYPSASRSVDFFNTWSERQAASEKAKSSSSEASTKES